MTPAQVPTFYRRWVVLDGPDVDFAASQNIPTTNLIMDFTRLQGAAKTICVQFIPWSGGSLGTGTLDLQCVVVDEAPSHQGQTPYIPVMGSPIQEDVALGQGATFDVSGCRKIAIRIAGSSTTADYCDLYVRVLEE